LPTDTAIHLWLAGKNNGAGSGNLRQRDQAS
jgi:hypothetical protein